ncbi:S8 family serine peptidase [Pontibacter sp. 172403-2]|uniref:S8 family serine peptidase n=1 Tax=Pontibacter rufus TaxID=2791028 RepID=UPI0018AF6129|nr:S8 family serine peptidase [Pontibacter sp. 172403-2]MBF9253654.1 S8 family serine peptidase [Pontibacter sp. 172403-2]
MKQLLLYLLLLLYAPALVAQQTPGADTAEQKHLVYFTDKKETPFSIDQPQAFLSAKAIARRQRQHIPVMTRDLPVDPAYVDAMKQQGIEVWYTSRWFNAAVVQCSDEQLAQLQALPFVKSTYTLNKIAQPHQAQVQRQAAERLPLAVQVPAPASVKAYGPAYHQANMLGALDLHMAGFRGQGMTIAVLDAGFPGVNTIAAFSHLFGNEQLKGTFDFVLKEENVFGANAHGTSVLSTMAAYAPGTMLGTAYEANYLLLRTEDAATEHPIEEINWLLAAEYADSAGTDVINSSLGYTTFDAPSESYTYADMDGNTTLISRAADIAAATGILVVVSAGNDGDKDWHYISAPADADSVLAVGAVDSLGLRAPFSSFGPTPDGRIKPDVVALGQNAYVLSSAGHLGQSSGTSFAGPIMAGFAACLWQATPGKTSYEMIQLLHRLGSNASSPDDSTGYGIPNYTRLVTALPELSIETAAFITNPVLQEEVALSFGEVWAPGPVSVSIYDMTGKRVYHETLKAIKTRHVLGLQGHQLKQGLYICRLRAGSRSAALRFVKL